MGRNTRSRRAGDHGLDGETGFLVTQAVEDGLADALARVLTQPQLARRLGAAAGRRAQEFSIRRHVQRLEEIYTMIYQGAYARRNQRRTLPPTSALHRPERS